MKERPRYRNEYFYFGILNWETLLLLLLFSFTTWHFLLLDNIVVRQCHVEFSPNQKIEIILSQVTMC